MLLLRREDLYTRTMHHFPFSEGKSRIIYSYIPVCIISSAKRVRSTYYRQRHVPVTQLMFAVHVCVYDTWYLVHHNN